VITFNFEKTSAWIAFIFGILLGFGGGFVAQPYVMAELNNFLINKENQDLKDEIARLKQQISEKPDTAEEAVSLLGCDKLQNLTISCKFSLMQQQELIRIYAYSTVLKAQQWVIGTIKTVQANDAKVSTIKTDIGEISSWKFSNSSTFTVIFGLTESVAAGSVELFIKIDNKPATTFKFELGASTHP